MPTYVYVCENCEYTEDRFGPYSKSPKKTNCPKCLYGDAFIRCIGSGYGTVFKGEGWPGKKIKETNDALKEADKLKKQMYDQSKDEGRI